MSNPLWTPNISSVQFSCLFLSFLLHAHTHPHKTNKRLIIAHFQVQPGPLAMTPLCLTSDQDWDTHVISYISYSHRHGMKMALPISLCKLSTDDHGVSWWRMAEYVSEPTQTHIFIDKQTRHPDDCYGLAVTGTFTSDVFPKTEKW